MRDSDEKYIIDLCDRVLGLTALRQYRFPFLLGDPGKDGVRRSLPVDAFYSELNLLVEYRERQHTEAVPFMDRRMTVSGIPRGEQRRLYDQRRREVLPVYGITLVEFDCTMFAHDARKRLLRLVEEDVQVIRRKLSPVLKLPIR